MMGHIYFGIASDSKQYNGKYILVLKDNNNNQVGYRDVNIYDPSSGYYFNKYDKYNDGE